MISFHLITQEAVDYLVDVPEVHSDGVGAIAVSKGGDVVLNMALHIDKVGVQYH